MNQTGLNQGTSGNISAIHENTMLITPSGVPYDDMQPDQIALMSLVAGDDSWEGPLRPSSEWHFHKSILMSNPFFGAVVHTHSTFATILSIARKPIPSCHYMVAAFGGNNVRCAGYATFGTEELSQQILKAMEGRSACLMANHGMVVAGSNLEKAMWAAVELETLAKQYYHACQQDSIVLLPDSEMEIIVEKFKTYGLKFSEKS